jgi:hypothetical protein
LVMGGKIMNRNTRTSAASDMATENPEV